MSKKISFNKFYYIRDSYVVEYEGSDKKIRPYICIAHSKRHALVLAITSKRGSSNYATKRRLLIPKELSPFKQKSYIKIDSPIVLSRSTPFKNCYKIKPEFSNFLKDNLIINKIAIQRINKIKKWVNKREKDFNKNFEESIIM